MISNVTAKPTIPDTVKETLVQQITAPVRWSQSIQGLITEQDVPLLFEWGTGQGPLWFHQASLSRCAVDDAGSMEDIENL